MSDETIIITKKEYDILIGFKDDYFKLFDMYNETMRLYDGIVKTYDEKCVIYKKALRM